MDYYNHIDKTKKKLTGYQEQEVLIQLFAACIAGIVGMNEETLKLYLSQALQDALDKRKMTFKHVKSIPKEEKVKFINDLVLYTVKRAKLVSSVDYSPDGSMFLACSIDGTARLWDAATFKPIGSPLEHNFDWSGASYSPDGSRIMIESGPQVKVWQTPSGPLRGTCEQIACWVEVVTGMELDSTGGINVLDASAWHQHRQRLQELGGPPQGNPSDFDRRSQTKGL